MVVAVAWALTAVHDRFELRNGHTVHLQRQQGPPRYACHMQPRQASTGLYEAAWHMQKLLKLTSMYSSSASRAPGSAAGTGSMQRKGVNRLAHHFTSAMPGWSGGSSSTNSPPSSRVCRRAEVLQWKSLHPQVPNTATSCLSLSRGCTKVHNCMLAVLLDTHKACPQSGSAGALYPHAAVLLGAEAGTLRDRVSQQHPAEQCGSKAMQLRVPTSSPSSARQHALKSACLVGSKPPAATAYII